jgi:hypothetical protein
MAYIQVKPPKFGDGGPGLFSLIGVLAISLWAFVESANFIETTNLVKSIIPSVVIGVGVFFGSYLVAFRDLDRIRWQVSALGLGTLAGVAVFRLIVIGGSSRTFAIVAGICAFMLMAGDQFAMKR